MTDLDVKFKNDRVTFVTDNVIWNAYAKDDLDQEGQLTKQQWLDFVSEYEPGFAEAVGEIAHEMYALYCREHKLGSYEDE